MERSEIIDLKRRVKNVAESYGQDAPFAGLPCNKFMELCDAALSNAVNCEGLAQKLVQIVDEDATDCVILEAAAALRSALSAKDNQTNARDRNQ